MHKLLRRQLERALQISEAQDVPEPWRTLVEAVDQAYGQADEDRKLLERSLELTSQELLQLNEELARSNAELEQFAYVASHDLREPLRSITGYSQLLSKRCQAELGEDGQTYLDGVVRGAERMSVMIEALLSYARAGTQRADVDSVELDGVMAVVCENLREAIEDGGAEVIYAGLPAVTASRSEMVQLLQNLVSNALKFRGDRSPRVEVVGHARASRATITVRDNGIGIAPEHRDRIFQLFQRLHGRTEYGGTGIGLAVCAKVVERHGGRMWVDGNPGQGSDFSFTIPIKSDTP